jgi:hypothetical protein
VSGQRIEIGRATSHPHRLRGFVAALRAQSGARRKADRASAAPLEAELDQGAIAVSGIDAQYRGIAGFVIDAAENPLDEVFRPRIGIRPACADPSVRVKADSQARCNMLAAGWSPPAIPQMSYRSWSSDRGPPALPAYAPSCRFAQSSPEFFCMGAAARRVTMTPFWLGQKQVFVYAVSKLVEPS